MHSIFKEKKFKYFRAVLELHRASGTGARWNYCFRCCTRTAPCQLKTEAALSSAFICYLSASPPFSSRSSLGPFSWPMYPLRRPRSIPLTVQFQGSFFLFLVLFHYQITIYPIFYKSMIRKIMINKSIKSTFQQ